APIGTKKHLSLRKCGLFCISAWHCLATAGGSKQGFFVASMLVLSISDAMSGARYHAALPLMFMASDFINLLFSKVNLSIFACIFSMVSGPMKDETRVDRYQAAQPQAQGQALQGE